MTNRLKHLERCMAAAGVIFAVLAGSAVPHGAAQAQAFPSKPVTIIVPFGPGGTSDQAARLAAAKVAASTGVQVLVENKPGANGQTAIAALKQLPADGHTLLWVSMGIMAINPWLYPKLNYEPLKDFQVVTGTFASTHFLLVPAASPAKNVADLVAMARAKPGQLSVASVGIGSGSHLVGEIFKARNKLEINHVPYKGSTSAIPDAVAGRVDVFFDGPTSVPLIREGKLRALAVTDTRRAPILPDVPTMAEAGFAGSELNSEFGLIVLAGTAPPVVERLNAEFVKAFQDPEVAKRIAETGGRVIAGPASEFGAQVTSEHQRMGQLIKAAGIKTE